MAPGNNNDNTFADSDREKRRWVNPVIEAYKKDVDRSLIREMLRLNVEDRLRTLERCVRDAAELRRAGIAATNR